ncbi:unnamed protein product [Vitrella brassicaformis CCMP3155]|uniref:Uncharacterized protein n=2 Tax=Vitrella brassicaformis TaxID=1169539 RepID=A0A0G4FTH7_VITBC|nr:unnamed protein product [Vitrella brassicaformis CCMP3155]|eukprot:CEM17659.1 unnamed protein product [Vitrella brassicaformis CCMP3155]
MRPRVLAHYAHKLSRHTDMQKRAGASIWKDILFQAQAKAADFRPDEIHKLLRALADSKEGSEAVMDDPDVLQCLYRSIFDQVEWCSWTRLAGCLNMFQRLQGLSPAMLAFFTEALSARLDNALTALDPQRCEYDVLVGWLHAGASCGLPMGGLLRVVAESFRERCNELTPRGAITLLRGSSLALLQLHYARKEQHGGTEADAVDGDTDAERLAVEMLQAAVGALNSCAKGGLLTLWETVDLLEALPIIGIAPGELLDAVLTQGVLPRCPYLTHRAVVRIARSLRQLHMANDDVTQALALRAESLVDAFPQADIARVACDLAAMGSKYVPLFREIVGRLHDICPLIDVPTEDELIAAIRSVLNNDNIHPPERQQHTHPPQPDADAEKAAMTETRTQEGEPTQMEAVPDNGQGDEPGDEGALRDAWEDGRGLDHGVTSEATREMYSSATG